MFRIQMAGTHNRENSCLKVEIMKRTSAVDNAENTLWNTHKIRKVTGSNYFT